jgi:formylglycine-generating enzyme required for sulfatase activity
MTALHYQTDMERVALVVQEAALVWEPPLPAAAVAWLADQDAHSVRWTTPLTGELRTQRGIATGPERVRVETVLAALERGAPVGESTALPYAAARWRMPLRWVMGSALVLVLAGLVWWQAAVRRPSGMVEAPPGSYVVRDPGVDGAERRVGLDGFLIDRFEVTNRAYRRCYARGACPWPSNVHSATRQNYFLERGFAEYPVVNVSQEASAAYCRWAGKRLPTAEEWEVAAGYAPATNRQYRYPWGAHFEPQRANSVTSGLGDTVAVGQYRAAGDSMLGASDMAGNVAEWTGTQVQQGESAGYVVKGGSYADAADSLATVAQVIVPGAHAHAWLGIRCARTVLLDQQ